MGKKRTTRIWDNLIEFFNSKEQDTLITSSEFKEHFSYDKFTMPRTVSVYIHRLKSIGFINGTVNKGFYRLKEITSSSHCVSPTAYKYHPFKLRFSREEVLDLLVGFGDEVLQRATIHDLEKPLRDNVAKDWLRKKLSNE